MRQRFRRHALNISRRPNGILVLALALLVAVVASASALAATDPSEESSALLPSQADVKTAIESGVSESALASLTEPAAAEGVSLEGLQREEALELLSGVFGGSVEAAAGIYDELQEATLLSPTVAVLPEAETNGAEEPSDEEAGTGSEGGEPQLEGKAGRDEAAEAVPEAEAREVTGPPPEVPAEPAEASLVDSTVPLQVGEDEETLDLSLEHQGGALEPVAPLVKTRIPGELNEEIELPESAISIEVAGVATERSASISGGSVAFYPNVAEDADLAISPTPTGVETMTQLRSPDSPDVGTYRLSLPPGASLLATEAGGAQVRSGEELLLSVPAPTAIDASGEAVPVDLEVSGDTLRVRVDPDASTPRPILVDPLFQTYEWDAKKIDAGICSSSFGTTPPGDCAHQEEWGLSKIEKAWGGLWHLEAESGANGVQHGVHVRARNQQEAGNYAKAFYSVPRYFKETPAPTSYIKSLKFSDVDWEALGTSLSPYLFMGIWDSSDSHWVSYFTHTGQVEHGIHDHAFVYEFINESAEHMPDTHAKAAQISINATEATANSNAHVYVGAATVELGDSESPTGPVTGSQTQWVNQTAPPLSFSATDTGLGVYAIKAITEEKAQDGSPLHTWKALNGCVGVGNSACPRTWISSESGPQALTYEPALLPSGIDYLGLVAEDPVGNKSSTSWAEVKVDHIAPTIAFTGSMTEQELLGTRRATYTLKATGSDGNAEHPQSGMSKAEVKLDGKAVAMEGKQAEEWSPKCSSQNCPLAAEWTLSTTGLAEGKHTIEVIATDAVGMSTTKTLTIETHAATPPTLALSGSMTEQGTLGTSRPRYALKAKSTAAAAGFEAPTLGAPATYASTLGGAYGEGTGRFFEPVDVATDSKGNVWVIDSQTRTANQLQEFNEAGEWLRSTGSSGNGKLKTPWGVAVDAANNLWVADTGNNRIVEFNEKGEFLQTFGTNVNKTKVESGGTEAEKNLCTAASGNVCQAATAGNLAGQLKSPKGIALTSGGNVWVADTGNSRIEKFGPTGALINNVSGEGTEAGKLKSPSAITVAPDNSIWVADTGNNRIEQWNSSLAFVRAVGVKGTGAGEFQSPSGIEADSTGAIWVGDYSNGRVQEFDENGTFIQKFLDAAGSAGTPRGLAIDPKGSIWVADQFVFKVYHWTVPGFPVYASSVGSLGSGNGQFIEPVDLAADSTGNFWVLDSEQNRLQEFDATGKWLRNAGAAGTGAGKLSLPRALATDSKNNVWVADTGNNRIVEFNEKGEFLQTFGTNVNKTKVEAGGTEAEKNLCTAASGNVCQAATAGSLAGQLKSPKGIALTSGGNVWVADTGNSRIEKFGPTGNMINNLSGLGSEAGKLKEPAAIAVAPDGSIWVADTGNNRIQQWNSSLSLVRAVGKEGSGGGEFKAPASIEADSSGNIWVGDQKNNRVEEFGEGGRYLGQFGANGSGRFSFSTAAGIAVDASGSIWVADPGHFKIQKWTQESPRSEITTTLWLDNNQQTGLHGTCKSAGCTIEPQWTVESQALSVGSHSAKVKTTDGLGRSTESTISFQIARDTTKPTLEAGGELVNAPEGWVEQETYGLSATANDAGAGVTSIAFKIDGQTVASASQSCPDGGCNETLSKQVSMAGYAGGAHPAEIVATDGAGNTSKNQWTINVDPEGHISTVELADTLEAAEGTANLSVVGSSPTEESEGSEVALEGEGENYSAIGSYSPILVSRNPANGVHIEIPTDSGGALQQISIVPTTTVSGATEMASVEGTAAASPNTGNSADTIVRPIFDGALSFQDIRDQSAPEEYSWEVQLESGQYISLTEPRFVQVYFQSGHPAFGIAAMPAADALGTTVPTSLKLEGNVITEVVAHRSAHPVYPVIAGVGWEGGYFSTEIQGPKDEKELWEEREQREREELELLTHQELELLGFGTLEVSAPEPVPSSEAEGVATISSVGEQRRTFMRSACGHRYQWFQEPAGYLAVLNGEGRCGNGFDPVNHPGEAVLWRGSMRGAFLYEPGDHVRHKNAHDCVKGTPGESEISLYAMKEASECQFGPKTSDGNGGSWAAAGHYLRAQAHWELGHKARCPGTPGTGECPEDADNPWIWEDKALELHLWPSGKVDETVNDGFPP